MPLPLPFRTLGLQQLIIDEANRPLITHSGDVILTSTPPDDALGALLLRLVADSCASSGDATKRVLVMVLAGLRQVLRSGLHVHTFQADLAAQVLQCVVPSAVLHVPLSPDCQHEAEEVLHALIHTHLCGKAGGGAAERHLAACLHELVVLQLRAAARAGASAAEALAALRDAPPLARLPGSLPMRTRLLPGVLLHEGPIAAPVARGPGTAAAAVAGVLLQRPVFLALTCPLEGEQITSVQAPSQAPPSALSGDPTGTSTPVPGPAVGVLVTSDEQRAAAERCLLELLRERVACLSARGVNLLLLCSRPPPAAAQLCQQYGIWLVAGLDEQDVGRACAAGGTAPLTRSGVAVLEAAPLGRASGARVVGLGPRRATLLEFNAEEAAGPAVSTLLLCGVNESAVRQAERAVRRCLVSVAAAVGTMDRAPAEDDDCADTATEAARGIGDPGECLVFVSGGAGFEALLELQLRELVDVAKRGPPPESPPKSLPESPSVSAGDGVAAAGASRGAACRGRGDSAGASEEEAAQQAAAEEARAVTQLLASLQVLHAMAAAVPLTLVGASGEGGGGGGGTGGAAGPGAGTSGGAGDGGLSAAGGTGLATGQVSPALQRARRAALLQIHELRQRHTEALQRGEVSRSGLLVPSAALSYHGRALRRSRAQDEEGSSSPQTNGARTAGGSTGAASAANAAAAGSGQGSGRSCAWGPGGPATCRGGSAAAGGLDSGGAGGAGGVCEERPPVGGHSFVAGNGVAHGVVEAAAVATSAWSHAVEVLVQVLRIDGSALPAVRQGPAGGSQIRKGLAGPGPVAVPRARRGGRRRGGGSSDSDEEARGSGDADSGSDD